MTVLYWTLGVVASQRLIELALASSNTARLRRLGAAEVDAKGYPLYMLLHAAWLLSLAVFLPAATPLYWPLIGIFALLQLGRIWVIVSLGRYWTSRVITLPDAPLVRTGPFRYFRHPNYLLVVAEIAVLPLAFGAVAIAATFSTFNVVLIARRIWIEERVLAPRRGV
ncbi:MAG: isoprenylcysteine carboxylmethyltransferase family protein [Stellaceae bacterium]